MSFKGNIKRNSFPHPSVMAWRSWKPSTPVTGSAIMMTFRRKACGPTSMQWWRSFKKKYFGSPGEKFVAQHHGFDRDFWAGSSNSPTTVLYRVHIKPRTAMFDPCHCTTTRVPVGARTVSRKTFSKDSRARRTVEIEHDFIQDKDAWSASVEGVKWTGVSMFRLASPVKPRVMRTGHRS